MADLILPGQSELGLALREPALLAPGRQPNLGNIEIDWRHPLSRGIFADWRMDNGRSLVSGIPSATRIGNRSFEAGAGGRGAIATAQAINTNYLNVAANGKFINYSRFTVECVFLARSYRTVGEQVTGLGGSFTTSLATNLWHLVLGEFNTASLAGCPSLEIRGSTYPQAISSQAVTLNKVTYVCGTYDTSYGIRLLHNGTLYSTAASGFEVGFPNGNMWIGCDFAPISDARSLNGDIYLFRLRDVALSEAEMRMLERDYYQIYKPANDSPYLIQTAAAALPTLSSATAINITSGGFQPRVTATY